MISDKYRARVLSMRNRHVRPQRNRTPRFYGAALNQEGQTRGFAFQVKVSERVNDRALHKLIAHTVGKIRYNKTLPVHKKGQAFHSFGELLGTRWIRMRSILHYDVSVNS